MTNTATNASIDACHATDEAERREAERIARQNDGQTQDWRGIQADWRKS